MTKSLSICLLINILIKIKHFVSNDFECKAQSDSEGLMLLSGIWKQTPACEQSIKRIQSLAAIPE